jgi:predicted esterase
VHRPAIETRAFELPLRCRYLVRPGTAPPERSLVFLALHGHAMTPELMLGLTAPLIGEEHTIAALQGPYQIWVNAEDTPRSKVAFHWATSFEPEHSRRLHQQMILRVLEECRVDPARAVLVGYSQSVSLNYRFVCAHPEAVRGVIGICGGLPGDWDQETARSNAAALHICTREDQYYPTSVTDTYAERLRRRIADVEVHTLEGGHRIPSAAAGPIRAWVERVYDALL